LGAGPFGRPAPRPDAETQTREIAKVLKCPVCQNIPVADSPSELAQQMRDLIRKQVDAGETREQILAYFADRYGDDVLLDPPRRGVGGVLWLGPLAIVGGGLALVGATLRHWRRESARRLTLTVDAAAVPVTDEEMALESLADAGGLTAAERATLAARRGAVPPGYPVKPVEGAVA